MMRLTLAERIEKYVVRAPGCWTWAASHKPSGYAQIWGKGTMLFVHRWMYEQVHGAIPEGFQIDHLCRNRGCINPDHLEAVTARINILRSDAPGAKAVRTGFCKRGHPFSGDNVYVRPSSGTRRCKKCHALDRMKRYREKRQCVGS
jgi:hypothetical protein